MTKVAKGAMVEQVCIRIGFFLYARIVAELGVYVYAAHNIAMQFLSLSFSFGDGIGIAGTALVGQSLGEKRPDIAHMYGKIAQRYALVAALLLATVVITCRGPLVGLYIYSDTANDAYVRQLGDERHDHRRHHAAVPDLGGGLFRRAARRGRYALCGSGDDFDGRGHAAAYFRSWPSTWSARCSALRKWRCWAPGAWPRWI